MVRKAILWLVSMSCLGAALDLGVQWSIESGAGWRNRVRAKRACRKYRKSFHRQCKVKRGLICGKGWRKISTIKHSSYLACRRAVRKEGYKKAKNVLNGMNPMVHAYKLYMAHISKGRRTMKLPRKLRKLYQPYYRVPLTKIRVGTSKHLKMSAITDCYRLFFLPELHMPRELRAGIFSDKETELFFLHELAHAEQCFKKGGRNNYANMWFRHLRKSVISNILKGKKLSSENIHKQQPMEKKAERKAIRVQQSTKNHRTR